MVFNFPFHVVEGVNNVVIVHVYMYVADLNSIQIS